MSGALHAAVRALFGSTGAAVTELRGADAVLRTPLPLSRRIGVVSVNGGCGATAVATALANVVARRRDGLVLAVDAAGGTSGLARRHDVEPSSAVPSADDQLAADERQLARTAAEACAGLTRTPSGLRLLDLAYGQRRAVDVSEWAEQVAPIARFFDLVVTDWGTRPAAGDLADVAATSHVVVVVARADRRAATTAAGIVEALRRPAGPGDERAEVLLVLVDVGRTSDRMLPVLRRRLGPDVLLLPADPSRSRVRAADGRDFSVATRTGHIRLARAVLAATIRGRQASGRTPVPVAPRSMAVPG